MKITDLINQLQDIKEKHGDINIGFKFFEKDYDIALKESDSIYKFRPYDYYVTATVIRGRLAAEWDNPKIIFTHKFNIGDTFVIITDGSLASVQKVSCILYDTRTEKLTYKGQYNREYIEAVMMPLEDTDIYDHPVDIIPYFKKGDKVYIWDRKCYGIIEGFEYINCEGQECISCFVKTEDGSVVCCAEKSLELDLKGYHYK